MNVHSCLSRRISKGEKPVLLLGALLIANKQNLICDGQSTPLPIAFLSIGTKVPWNLSMTPFDCGWYGEDWILLILNFSHNPSKSLHLNCFPWSERMDLGTPCLLNNSKSPSATASAVIHFKGSASGYLLAGQVRVRRYLWPLFALGMAPLDLLPLPQMAL